METKTGKRIVSKGEYALLVGKREALRWGSVGMAVAIAVCLLLATGLVFVANLEQSVIAWLYLVLAFAGYAVAWRIKPIAENAMQKALTKLDVVPLTRANTADLTTQESLVRASSQPVQAQEAVLLRVATEIQERSEEQLLQASVEPKTLGKRVQIAMESEYPKNVSTHPVKKRVVSKGMYAQAQGRRTGLQLWGLCLYFMSFIFFLQASSSMIELLYFMFSGADRVLLTIICSVLVLITGTGFYFCLNWGKNAMCRAAQIDPGIPLTRANTADLPAPDSLVRASSEPVMKQKAVLLRAAIEGQGTPPEQLVRPADGR